MVNNRKQRARLQIAKLARFLAGWLNQTAASDDANGFNARSFIAAYLGQDWPQSWFPELAREHQGGRGVTVGANWPVHSLASVNVDHGRVDFRLRPCRDRDRALLALGELHALGETGRVKLCPNCGRFFYAPRRDRQACSANCKVSLWQKTPAGRETKRLYMQQTRAKQKRLWEAKQKGRKLGRGRKIHSDLKKGE